MSAYTYIIAIAIELLTLLLIAARLGSVLRTVVQIQVVYWGLGYIARPLLLLVVAPAPALNDSIADPRLANGDYQQGLLTVLGPVAFGLLVYVLAIGVVSILFSRALILHSKAGLLASRFIPAFWMGLAIGWAARIASLRSPDNNLLATLAFAAAVGACGLILTWLPGRSVLYLGVALVSELVWTVFSHSKTPIFAAVVALLIRFAQLGWTRRRMLGIAAIGLASLLGFAALQSLKITQSTQLDLSIVDSTYPHAVVWALPILRRFDLLSSATDALYFGAGHWMNVSSFVSTITTDLIPQQLLGSSKVASGVAWATQIRAASTGFVNPNVSLADGFIAEGYIFAGLGGIVLEALIVAALTLGASMVLESRFVFVKALAILVLCSSAFDERGLLGISETVGKGLEVALVVWLGFLLIRTTRISPRPLLEASVTNLGTSTTNSRASARAGRL